MYTIHATLTLILHYIHIVEINKQIRLPRDPVRSRKWSIRRCNVDIYFSHGAVILYAQLTIVLLPPTAAPLHPLHPFSSSSSPSRVPVRRGKVIVEYRRRLTAHLQLLMTHSARQNKTCGFRKYRHRRIRHSYIACRSSLAKSLAADRGGG